MRRAFTIAAALAAATAVAAAGASRIPQERPRFPASAGTGERLVVVVGGAYAGEREARAAALRTGFGELQGFYVARSDVFDGEPPGRWLLVSAFRTLAGAAEFEALARAAGATSLRRVVTTYRGSAYIGLGQEPHPDGSGPLLAPLPDGHPARI